jgi:RND superfamily putative drug exporter
MSSGFPDQRVLPAHASSRAVHDTIGHAFGGEATDALLVSGTATSGSLRLEDIAIYASGLSAVPGIAEVESAAGVFAGGARIAAPSREQARFLSGEHTWLRVTPRSGGLDTDPAALVREVRSVKAAFATKAGGYPAELADFRAMVLDRVPFVLLFIATVNVVILYFVTRSIVLPLKATILNALSLSVMFGVLVFVFQDGHFAVLLGFTPLGTIETSTPILMVCIAYGLSMDYEVFMLSRISEEHRRGASNADAVVVGLERCGPVITAAAAILALSFLAYLSSEVVPLKMIGLCIAVTIITDATVIRALLVPSFMRLAGDFNWWSPWRSSVHQNRGNSQ